MANENINLANTDETTWLWPAPYSNKYCSRGYFVKNVNGAEDSHLGIDLVNPSGGIYGTPVVAAKSGTVVSIFKGCYNHNAIYPWNDSSKWKNCSRARSEEDGSIINLNGCDYDDVENYGTVDACNYTLGNGLVIEHTFIENGETVTRYSQYAHLSELAEDIALNTSVERGQIIGYVGSTGESSGPHLHFSLNNKGKDEISNGRYNNNPKNKDSNGNYIVSMGSYHSTACPITCDSNTCTRDYDYEGGQYYDFNISLIESPYDLAGGDWDDPEPETEPEKTRYNLIRSRCSADYIRDKNFLVNVGGTAKIRSDVPKEPEDYEFDGWLCNKDSKVYDPGDTITGLGTSTDVTLTAQWVSKKVTVTYDLNGGTGTIPSQTVTKGESFKLSTIVPTKTGWHFRGWSVEDSTEIKYPGASMTVTQDTTLTAVWEEKVAVIRYDTGGAMDIEDTVIKYSATENGQIPVPLIHYPGGMRCSEWTVKYGDGTVYNSDYGDCLPEFKSYILVAHDLQRAIYSVTYSFDLGLTPPEDGEPIDNSDVLTEDEKQYGIPYYIQKAIPRQYYGHNFLYWQDEDGNKYAPGEKVEANRALNLTAQWVGGCFAVQFEGGVDATDTRPVSNIPLAMSYPVLRNEDGSLMADVGITLPDETPVRQGYVFYKWFCPYGKDASLFDKGTTLVIEGSLYQDFDPMEQNVIPLIAVWEPADVTVNIHDPYNGSNYLNTYTARVGERYGNAYVNGSVTEIAFPVIQDRGETIHVGWCYGGDELTEDSIVTVEDEHSLTPVWYEETEYTDVEDLYAEEKNAIAWCKYKGYMTGSDIDGESYFYPANNLKRRDAAMTLYKCMGKPAWGTNDFYDVKSTGSYSEAVSWAKDNGIMSGTSEYTFAPEANITRAQFVTALYRFCGLIAPDKQAVDCGVADSCPCASYGEGECLLAGFDDSADLGTAYRQAMVWAVAKGIISGTDATTLSHGNPLTRTQCAIILRRFFDYIEA